MADYNMGTARGRIVIEYDDNGVRRFGQDMDRTQNRSRSASSVFKGMSDGMGKAGLGIAAGFGLAVKAAADFEKVMSGIKAVTGASGADMDLLRAKALKLGADTKFSASEAATAMEELAKAGISVPDILNGAADAAVNLAAAGGVDLKTAAELAANAMNQFALSAKDLPGVADLIAGAANSSAIDVGEFGLSLKQVGAVAHLVGLSFRDTAVAIAIMGNAGIKGSDAGTSLKTMLSNLVPHSDRARATMKDLGIITKDGANQFFDASGKAKSLADISQVLQNALKGQTKEQKLATLNTLFGSDAIRGAAILADQGATGFNKMSDAMGRTSAADVAKTRMDNLSGSVEQLKGSLETMFIKMGEGGQGPLKTLVDWLTKLVNGFNSLSTGSQQTITTITLLTGAFLLLGSATIRTVLFFQRLAAAMRVIAGLSAVQTVLVNLRGVLFVLTGELNKAAAAMGRAALAALKLAGNALKSAALAMGRLAVATGKAALSLLQMAGRGLAQATAAMGRFIVSAARAAATMVIVAARAAGNAVIAFGQLAASAARAAASMAIVAARAVALGAANFASTLAQGAAAMATMAANAARAAIQMALMAARVIIVNGAMLAARVATLAWAAAMAILNVATGPIGLIVIAIVALIAVIVLVATKTKFFQTIWSATWNFIKAAFATVVEFIKQHWQLIIAIIFGPLGIIVGLVITHFNQIKNFISNAISTVVNFVKSHWKLLVAIIGGPIAAAVLLVIKYWSQIKSFVFNTTNAVVNFVKSQIGKIKSGFANLGSLPGLISGIFGRILSAVRSKLSSMLQTVRGIPGKIRGVFSGAGSWLFNAGKNIIQGLINGVQSKISQFTGLLKKLTGMIPDLKGPKRKDLRLLSPAGQHIMEGLMIGIGKRIPALQKLLSGVTTSIVQNGPVMTGDTGHLQWQAPPTIVQNKNLIDWNALSRALATELKRAGVGTTQLDGKVISDVVNRIQGRNASYQRRAR
jgi:TP901 family phage tail tape measure protein